MTSPDQGGPYWWQKKVRCWHFWRKKFDCGYMGHVCMKCWRKHLPLWAHLSMRKHGIVKIDDVA